MIQQKFIDVNFLEEGSRRINQYLMVSSARGIPAVNGLGNWRENVAGKERRTGCMKQKLHLILVEQGTQK